MLLQKCFEGRDDLRRCLLGNGARLTRNGARFCSARLHKCKQSLASPNHENVIRNFEKCASELAFFGYPPAIAIENRPLAQDLTAREIQGSVVAPRLGELEGVVALIEKKHASRLQLLIQESDLRFEPLEGEASLERAQSLSAVLSPLKDSHTKDGIEALH